MSLKFLGLIAVVALVVLFMWLFLKR